MPAGGQADKALGSSLQEMKRGFQSKKDQAAEMGCLGKELEEKPKQTVGADAGEENTAWRERR